MRHPKGPVHETLALGACLALTGGFLDAYTYLSRGGVFAYAQTGNLVLMGVSLARGDFRRAGALLLPLAAFCLGIVATEALGRAFRGRGGLGWRPWVLLAEAAALAGIALLPAGAPDGAVTLAVSFLSAAQWNSFRSVRGMSYASTMCTGNLRSAMEHLFRWAADRNREAGVRAAHYFAIVGAFLAGAAASAWTTAIWGGRTARGAAVLALAGAAVWRGERAAVRERTEQGEQR